MTTIQFDHAVDSEVITVRFPYDPDAVATIKEFVPGSFRSFNAQAKTWSVNGRFGEELTEAFLARGHQVMHGALAAEPGPEPTVEQFFAKSPAAESKKAARAFAKERATEIVASLPGQHAGAIFREMAKLLYPDLYRR